MDRRRQVSCPRSWVYALWDKKSICEEVRESTRRTWGHQNQFRVTPLQQRVQLQLD